jgi:hypothetical protein
VISFAWFWSLCRLSSLSKPETNRLKREANLVPFERGIKLGVQKSVGL